MNIIPRKSVKPATLILFATITAFFTSWLWAQFPGPFATPTTPDAQRSFMKAVQAQIGWLQNSTRTAPSYATGGADLVWQQFQSVRQAYNSFKSALTPQQLQSGANDLAELDAGLDIIREAFTGYQNELADGRSASTALRSLCQVLNQAAGIWLQEFKKDCIRMRAG